MATLTGKTIGGYEIMEEVGRGAMGVVFKARQVSMDRVVALKFLPRGMAQKEKLVQRFMREARAAGKLSHPNIVAVHDVGQLEGLYFISMEFIDGTSAHKLMKERGTLPENEVLGIGRQIASALKEAHGRGILHRDVKPDNFLIDSTGRARLADLGTARINEPGGSDEAHLTQDGTALGTPHYMSPEQARGKDVDLRSDLYGLGASMYTLATGKTLFDGATAAAVMVAAIQDTHKPLKQVNPELSPGFCAVVEKLLQKDPAKRYQDAQEVSDALEKIRQGEAAPTTGRKTPVGPAQGARAVRGAEGKRTREAAPAQSSPAVMIGVGVGAAVLVLVALMAMRKGDPPAQTNTARASSTESKQANTESAAPAGPTAEERAAKQKQDEADKAFAALLRRHEAALAGDPAGLVPAWESFVKEHPRAKQAEQARGKLEEAKAAALNLQREWDGVRGQADALAADGKLKEAYEKLAAFQQQRATSPHAAEVVKKMETLRDAALVKLKEHIAQALGSAESGDTTAARQALDKLALVAPGPLAEAAGMKQAYEKIEALELAAKTRADVAEQADARRIEEALAKAEGLVRNPEARFHFAEAVRALRDAASQVNAPAAKIRAGVWAERFDRAGKLWDAAKAAVTGGKKAELPALGSFTKGEVTGWEEKGLRFRPEGFPDQLVTWKVLQPYQAVQVLQTLNAPAEAKALELGLFAYATGAAREAVQWLGKVNEADKGLADEPRARALSLLDKDAQTAFEAAKAAAEKKDMAAVKKELAPLVAPGALADTAFAKSHADEIQKLLQAEGPAAVATAGAAKEDPFKLAAEGKDATEDLKRAGWTGVEGEWKAVPNKPGSYYVKDGKLRVDATEGSVSLSVQVKAGTVAEVLFRVDEGGLERSRGFVGMLRFGNQAFADKLEKALKDCAEGYGVRIEGGKGRVYAAGPLESLADEAPEGGGPGGRGPGGRGRGGDRGGQGWWKRTLGEAPAKLQEFDLAGEVHRVAVTVANTKLDAQVNDKTAAQNHRMRDNGGMVIRVTGEAIISQPLLRK